MGTGTVWRGGSATTTAQSTWPLYGTPAPAGKPARQPQPCFPFIFQMHISPRPANPSKAGSWEGKVFRSVGPCLLWMASIPHPTAARLCLSVQSKGDFASCIFLAIFFPSLNVEKLNARFEFLIRLSSFCHLFCFVMHYIQLHISNPQILPRRWNTCQAFPFHCIESLWRQADITECQGALASPSATILQTGEPLIPKDWGEECPIPALRVSSPGSAARSPGQE